MAGSDSQSMSPLAGFGARITDFQSALSPTAPFPQDAARLKLAALLVPAIAVAMLTSSAMFMKMNTFLMGLGFFGDPIIWRAASWLNREFPHWQKLLEIRK